jgi:outer membrane receptor protein involved in Fe transport
MARVSIAVIIGILATAGVANSQTTTATVQGVVRDASQGILPGATVSVRNVDTGFARTTVTDDRGAYSVTFIPPGRYEIVVDLQGFRSEKREGIRAEIGQAVTVDFSLAVAGVAETVTVTTEAPLVDTSNSTVDKVITREQIDGLPLNGRNPAQLALLAPGVVSRGGTEEPVTADGQPRGSGETLIDGVSNELVLINSIRSNAPPDAIQEFQVLTGQYQAEFGNSSGLILNTITRSGTNTLQGRGYYFHRDEALDARNAFATTKNAFEQTQGGGWAGGPIRLNKTHFFASYEGTRRVSVVTVTSPYGPGDFDQPFDNNQLLAKITHQLNDKNHLTGRFSLDRPFNRYQGVGGLTVRERGIHYLTQDRAYVGNLTTIVSNRFLNELRVQVSDGGIRIDVDNPDSYTINRPTGNLGKPANQPQAIPELRFQVVDNVTVERGRHRFKFGVDVQRITSDGYLYQNIPGVFQFATDRPFDPNDLTTYPTTFTQNQGDVNFEFLVDGFAAFVQDTWQLPSNVTINAGLRYDRWSMTGTDLRDLSFAPRLGVAWDPGGDGKTSIRGGVGVFYNNIMTNVPIFTAFFAGQRTIVINNPGYPDPFSRGSAANIPLSTYLFQEDQPLPRTYNTTIGVQRQIVPRLAVGVDYVHAKGRQLLQMIETNPVQPVTLTRLDPTRGFIRRIESRGYSNYNGLLFSTNARISTGAQVGVAYTLSAYKTSTEAENGLIQADDLNPDDSYAYGGNDQRHRTVINGTVTLPWAIQLSGILFSRSGVPVNITTGSDNNRNGTSNDRPDLAPGVVLKGANQFDRSNFVAPGARTGNLPRNAARGPSFWQVDLRVQKTFPLGRSRMDLIVEAFNLTNKVNLFNPVGNLASASFGRSVSADIARQVQLGVRLGF